MSPQLGVILLMLALTSAVYAFAAALIGARRNDERLIESARNAAIMTWPLLTAAALTLIRLLVTGDFNTAFVWAVSDNAMPTYLKVTALWGGQAGSLLFWSWLMSTFAATAMLRNWKREHDLMPYAIAAAMGTLTFFIILVTFWENPFTQYFCLAEGVQSGGGCKSSEFIVTAMFGPSAFLSPLGVWWHDVALKLPGLLGIVAQGMDGLTAPLGSQPVFPDDGNGLNPLLRHPGMIIHPPMLYLGFVSFVIPFSFAMAALARGEISDSWIRATRRWTLVGWLFLSLGLILGGWWAYDVLGWGGYWAWDPVENAALMPWLTGTAFLHSVMIQEKRGMMRRWNMILIIMTYLLVILGTLMTRSGLVSSVHSFAQSAIGPLFLIFLSTALVLSVWLMARKWDDLAGDHQLDSLLSRETVFLLNNFLFVSICIAVGIGTYWPLVTELLANLGVPGVEKSSLGADYFLRTTGPMFLVLLLLMGIAPLVAWHRSSIRRLGKTVLIPLPPAVGFVIIMQLTRFFGEAARTMPTIAYGVIIFTAGVTLLEFHRGAIARVQAHGEHYLRALWTLAGRNRRRYGGYLIHLGVVVMATGIVSSHIFQVQTQKSLAAGQTVTMGDYVFEYDNLERFTATDGRGVIRAQATVYHNGREVAHITPRIDLFGSGETATIPGKYASLTGDDFYVVLVQWEQLSLSSATFKIYFNPLVNWVWTGGFIFIFGTLVAAWPDLSEERRPVEVRQKAGRPVSSPAPAAGK